MAKKNRQPVEFPKKVGRIIYGINLALLVASLYLGVMLVAYTTDAVGMHVLTHKGGSGEVNITSCENPRFGLFHCRGELTKWDGDEFSVGQVVDVAARSERHGLVAVDGRTVTESRYSHRSKRRHYEDYSVVAPSDEWVMPDPLRLVYMVGVVVGSVFVMWLLLLPFNMFMIKRYRSN